MSEFFGADWATDETGMLFRNGARILIFDEMDRLLLIKGHDWGEASRQWWFTVGGGLLTDEDPLAGVLREAYEETGLALDASDIVGPVGQRSAVFEFALRTVRQDELFFVARGVSGEINPAGLSEPETQLLDEYRWWHLDDLADAQRAGETVYPLDLVDFARSVVTDWDGTVRQLSGQ